MVARRCFSTTTAASTTPTTVTDRDHEQQQQQQPEEQQQQQKQHAACRGRRGRRGRRQGIRRSRAGGGGRLRADNEDLLTRALAIMREEESEENRRTAENSRRETIERFMHEATNAAQGAEMAAEQATVARNEGGAEIAAGLVWSPGDAAAEARQEAETARAERERAVAARAEMRKYRPTLIEAESMEVQVSAAARAAQVAEKMAENMVAAAAAAAAAAKNEADYHLHHPQLGEVVGMARGDDIVQFRGLPFAAIPGRFRQATLLEQLPENPFDARQPGAYCPQPHMPFLEYWDGGPVSGSPEIAMPPMDEFACLNVDITAPRSAVESGNAGVPVLFFVHGGAYIGGSHSVQVARREVYDGTDLVRASVAAALPVVLVTCNYRLGPLGFLASEELAAFNAAHGEPVGNYGLHDQRQALAWCARFIGGFGGDAGAMTISGTSAGGSSVHFQSIYPGPRHFQRVIASSGTMIGIGPMPTSYQQKNFDAYMAKVGDDGTRRRRTRGRDALDMVRQLQQLPVDDMVTPVTTDIYYPVVDDEWIKGGYLQDLETPRREDGNEPDLMIGACAYEQDLTTTILMDMGTRQPHADDHIRGKLFNFFASNGMVADASAFPSPHIADDYGLTATLKTPSAAVAPWAEFMADVAFRIPPLHIALQHRRASGVLVYNIEATNPYPNWPSSYGRANHAISDLFLFNAAPDQVPAELRDGYGGAVAQIRSAWLRFCHGILPWPPLRTTDGTLGPIYTFQNGPAGRLSETLEEAVGEQKATKWRSILQSDATV
ncbi:uncharacterized protein SPSK_08576 [Sporothrix schenckii 1099-18]|uniref:Carboxylesterase type B domain-containing protein n=1 Tax=Sporothrix schenckii 1099-18 TaxID=1397361 RepID=A0A0F2M3T9_SPOSC|nr:uncharacterized protein SPSK_08576 [Sporothrix schenckii 1099-18]KJR84373.1 hypothetical protein SPSK_08576 [Sporothrix schenckii 1099-18]